MRSRSRPDRAREYSIHDTALQGFMLRVQPNGARSWVFRFRRDGKPRRVTLGKPDAVKADQARAAALAFLAREKGGGSPVPLPASGPTLTKFAAEYVERRSPSWKPSTVKATLSYLNGAILPALGHLRVGSVVRADIARFFHEYGRRKPGGANRSHEILRNMFDCAIAWGHRPETAGIVADARLHDLRHAHASHAVMNGESLHVAGRLLGHRRATTTNRYVHLDDATLSQAAERVAGAIHSKL